DLSSGCGLGEQRSLTSDLPFYRRDVCCRSSHQFGVMRFPQPDRSPLNVSVQCHHCRCVGCQHTRQGISSFYPSALCWQVLFH
ncbi:unnamed protein product, partial [Mycena citricolor]